jgi:putative PIN family toxin of toxin-antitoxin system
VITWSILDADHPEYLGSFACRFTILLSAFQFENEEFSKIFEYALVHRYRLIISPYIIREFAEKSRWKFRASEEAIQGDIRFIARSAIAVNPKSVPLVIQRDPKDNHIIACALEGKADFIVSGDKDLLSLKEYQGIVIERPIDFLRTIGG